MTTRGEYLNFARIIAKDAGKIMKEHFTIGLNKRIKNDQTPVTVADTKVNIMVIERVKQMYPKHTILGEEESHGDHTKAKYTWVVDPIDGTRPFSMGVPTNVFSLALTENGDPVVAVVYDPYLDRMFTAIKGEGAHLNDQPIRVSVNANLDHTVHFIYESHHNPYKYRVLDELTKTDAHHMSFGSHIYGAMMVATGQMEFTVYDNPWAHDAATAKLIIEEAGGVSSDIEGNSQRYDKQINGFIAGNGNFEQYVAGIIKQNKKEKLNSDG